MFKEIKTKKPELIAYILLIITSIIWGGTWPLGRWLVSEEIGGATIPPLMIALIRYILAVICFLIIVKLKDGSLNFRYAKKYWKYLATMGFLSVTVYQTGYLYGEIYTSASDASIVIATNAIWVVILSSTILKTENFSWNKAIGIILAFFAVVLVMGFSPDANLSNRLLGDVLILIAALSYASYTVISRFFIDKIENNPASFQPSSLWIIAWVSVYGLILTTPIALITNPEYLNPLNYLDVPGRVWWGIFYLAFFSTVGAYTFYLEGVKRLNASRAAIFQTLVPLFGVILSAVFLKEKFDIIIYPISLILVILGIILVNYQSK